MINQIKIKNKNIIPIQNCLPKHVQSGCYIFNKNNLEIGIAQDFTIKNYISFYSNSFITDLRSYAFTNNCYNLQSFDLPNVINIGNYAFKNCSSLQSVNLPNATNIGEGAFAYCYSLKTANLPNATEIKYETFRRCSQLQSVNCPNITKIESFGFGDGPDLEIMNLPKVSYIGDYAFAYVSPLSQLAIGFSQVCILANTNAFCYGAFAEEGIGCTLYVPQSLVTAYQSATNWATVLAWNSNNQVLPIEGSPFDPNSQE